MMVVMYLGRTLLIPVVFAALLAMLMAPLCRKLEKKGFKRTLATLTCVLIIFFTVVGILAVIGGQFAAFKKDVPKIEQKFKQFVKQGQQYIEQKYGIEPKQQEQIAKQQAQSASQGGKKGGGIIPKIFGGITAFLGGIVLTLVYTFLMIYNKEHFENFFLKLYKEEDQTKVKTIVRQAATVAEKYLTGRAMSIMIIALMYSVGLSLVGIKNAILLAAVAAVMTLIPYLGTVLGGLFPVLMALATEDSVQPAIWAGVVLFFIQTVDNYFIEPNIVGGEVNLGALTTIISIIAGGLIWGVAGMILFLPLMGITKIVCDHVEPLKPIGFLIGEPGGKKPSKIKQWIQEKFGKKKKGSKNA
jgi:predicted PurR-regulated permease PerM